MRNTSSKKFRDVVGWFFFSTGLCTHELYGSSNILHKTLARYAARKRQNKTKMHTHGFSNPEVDERRLQ